MYSDIKLLNPMVAHGFPLKLLGLGAQPPRMSPVLVVVVVLWPWVESLVFGEGGGDEGLWRVLKALFAYSWPKIMHLLTLLSW